MKHCNAGGGAQATAARFLVNPVRRPIWSRKKGRQMKKSVLLLSLLAIAADVLAAKAPTKSITFAPGAGENALRVSVTPVENRPFALTVYAAGGTTSRTIRVSYPDRGWNAGGKLEDWVEDVSWSEYCRRHSAKLPMPKKNVYSNAIVFVASQGWFGFDYSMLPYFSPFRGLYRHRRVVDDIGHWLKTYPLYPAHRFDFEFRHDDVRDVIEGFLDGQFCGEWSGVGALNRVKVETPVSAEVVGTGATCVFRAEYRLPPLRDRAHPLLRQNARIELADDERSCVTELIAPWEPAVSVDQAAHRSTGAVRELCADPQSKRTPFRTGPEFMQWTVPCAFYRNAWVLCADLAEDGKEPVVGISMTRFGTSSVGSLTQSFVSLNDDREKANVRTVGKLVYEQDGARRETPLYLVRVRLDPFKILQYVNDLSVYGRNGKSRLARELPGIGSYLDIEFIGSGTWSGKPRSSVQIFGATLDQMDYAVEMAQSVRGNLFERGADRPETGVKVTATRDNAKGSIRWRIYDPLFRELSSGEKKFALAKKGESQRLSFDLDRPDVGWYGLDFAFLDADGNEMGVHEASYTILAPDDREWGCDSPYAAWPLHDGYHNSDPNRRQQAEVMRKAGYRGSWQPPVTNENEFGFPLTMTNIGAGHAGYNPCRPCSAAELTNHLDKVVAEYRKLIAAYPSCRYIQLLHEQGGRDVAPCLYDGLPHPRGEYRGIDGEWSVYYCTEFAKRMRREFPHMKIFLGNGSTSSEKVAWLVENGLDLNLVDQLGIESKGFSTTPENPCHREAVGCLWALAETGRHFGYSNLTLNACNEYVFRTERRLDRGLPPAKILQVASYSVRDYLLSLAHGCGIISTGHLEDCNDQYYDTNWGAGGQCTFYPFSYPKRMYTALAVFTRVFDRAVYTRTPPLAGHATYLLEFRRDRKSRDFAYACWTPRYGMRVEVTFPAAAQVKELDAWGVERPVSGTVTFTADAMPRYFVSSLPIERARTLGASPQDLSRWAFREICAPSFADVEPTCPDIESNRCIRCGYGIPQMPVGTWQYAEVADPEVGAAIEMRLVRTMPAPSPLLAEVGALKLRRPLRVTGGSKAPYLALKLRGNGSFGKVTVTCRSTDGAMQVPVGYIWNDTFIDYDGWNVIVFEPGRLADARLEGKEFVADEICFGSARQALNPLKMTEVTENLRFGGLYLCRELGAGEKPSEGELRAADVMHHDVSDKDL